MIGYGAYRFHLCEKAEREKIRQIRERFDVYVSNILASMTEEEKEEARREIAPMATYWRTLRGEE